MPSPNYRRELPTRFRLEASRCKRCGKVSYPKRPICPSCRDRDNETMYLSREGTVITSTVIHVPPPDLTMEGPVKPLIDALWPVLGGTSHAPADHRIRDLRVTRSASPGGGAEVAVWKLGD